MKALIMAGVNPHSIRPHEAANAVLHHILKGIAAAPDMDVVFLFANTEDRLATGSGISAADWPEDALVEKRMFKDMGVRFLDPLIVRNDKVGGFSLRRLWGLVCADPDYICSGAEHGDTLSAIVLREKPDVIVTVWSEFATAMAHRLNVPVFAYYGNPDPKVAMARIYIDWHIERVWAKPARWPRLVLNLARQGALARAHLKVMRCLAAMVNVAANDATDYAAKGVAGARYVRNMWAGGDGAADWEARRANGEQTKPIKIVTSVGNQYATGNTIGLYEAITRVAPALKRRLGKNGFEMHVFGGGQPLAAIAALLEKPFVKNRGFVNDLNAEILSAPIFLICNNRHPLFQVGNTRVLHAWSLGACVVAYRGSAAAMPEIEHETNALLGDTPEEIAAQIERAAKDPDLRRKLGRAGYETLHNCYQPNDIVPVVVDNVRAL